MNQEPVTMKEKANERKFELLYPIRKDLKKLQLDIAKLLNDTDNACNASVICEGCNRPHYTDFASHLAHLDIAEFYRQLTKLLA